ncbi:hypothetical protein [Anaerobiospirillum thomasii]|uniref:Uncharacterized protein n=1 Tax=Anaerobiospirillum thomasii TaxID=179995 RepID=A0A2X0V7R6_9GAMM|nr:hypothetical protein [Anaerobiospirillum thomasii]SPT70409.1 Uncharacterised protein [Anaerobiospirillum thomasii]
MIKATYEDDCEKLRSINQDLTFDYADKFFADAHLKSGHINKKTLCIICADGLYTNLTLLLSDQCIHTIKIAVFEGTERYKFKDRKEFTGSLLKQMTEAFEYIDFLNKTESTILV